MVIVDSRVGSRELSPVIRAMGVLCETGPLQWGDAAFDGNGPDGSMLIGVERKALHDMLACIDDSRYTGHQRIGMRNMYKVSYLIIEGLWRPREDGLMMESRDGCIWWVCRPSGKPVMYSKLRRYLISIAYSGVIVIFTRDMRHTAYDICELFHYHQKKWADHTSLLELHKIAIPQLNRKPSLALKWAYDIEGLGAKLAPLAERVFRKPIIMANADEADWLRVPGLGVKKATDIVKEIHGER